VALRLSRIALAALGFCLCCSTAPTAWAQNPQLPIEGAAEDLPTSTSETPPSSPSAEPTVGNQADTSPSQPAKPEASAESPYLPNPFNLPIPRNRGPYDYSQKIHCDVLRHLKVPATWRRLDTYMRPTYMLPKAKSDALADRDHLLAIKGRDKLFEQGVDIYGCSAVDYLIDVQSNLSSNPLVRGTQGPWHNW